MKRKLAVILLVCFAVACSSHGGGHLDPTKQSDKELYEIGAKYLKDEDCSKAREAFKLVFDTFPKSDYRILAKVGIGDGYYCEGNDSSYLLAVQEYQDFISLFPFSPKAEYAQIQIGMCYYNMHEKPDRDQTNSHKALDEFKKALDNYPNGTYYKEAYGKLLECYGLLAQHEYLIAEYYERTGKWPAAAERLKGLLKSYPEGAYRPEFYMSLARSLEEMEQNAESCVYYQKVVEKWPDSESTGDAKAGAARVCK